MIAASAAASTRGGGRPAIAVAALSARAVAEAAARDGFDVVALDLFGDADTRAAARAWVPIGRPDTMRIDAALLLAALRRLAASGTVDGWVAAGGMEADSKLLADGAALLPLIGTAPDDVRALRDPAGFFAWLDGQGADHPEVAFGDAPPAPGAWLQKEAGGCGGWHIRRVDAGEASPASPAVAPTSARRYFQREVKGRPMSATFVGGGAEGGAVVLGFNRLIVRSVVGHPFVFCGAIGPVTLPAPVTDGLRALVRALSRDFRIRGLASLDFLLDGDSVRVLEVNPRPPASLALYAATAPMAAHVAACRPGAPLATADAAEPKAGPVGGFEIVFARRALRLDDSALARLAAWPGVHDVPAAALQLNAGDPVCTLSTDADADADAVRHRLEARCDALLRLLETRP